MSTENIQISDAYLLGKNGRMGRAVFQILQENNFSITDHLEKAKILIDFSSPEGTLKFLPQCLKHKIPLVSGTTGFSEEQFHHLTKASEIIPIFYASNFSLGIYYLQKILQYVCKSLSISSANLIETHHVHKKDRPSGTAKSLLQILHEEKIPTHIRSIRREEQIGKHSLELDLQDEKITLSHETFNRRVFAQGAVIASQFIQEKIPGFYSMDDLLSHPLSFVS